MLEHAATSKHRSPRLGALIMKSCSNKANNAKPLQSPDGKAATGKNHRTGGAAKRNHHADLNRDEIVAAEDRCSGRAGLSTASKRLRPDRPAALSFLLRDPLGPHALSFSRPSIHLAMIAIGMGVSNVSPDSSPSLQRT